ncbi:MAG: polysaccharide deacetylase family protein [Geminicoccaceae bacterium]
MSEKNGSGVTEIIITIDTEFSAGGAFEDPSDKTSPVGTPNVTGPVNGEEQGLGFMLDTFARHGATATFFVETLHIRHFGPEPMGQIARRIQAAGHDVQMHLHPLWLAFDGDRIDRQMQPWPPDDDCAGRSIDELTAMMRHGIEAFENWGIPRPVALRTGNLAVDRNVYRAQAKAGLPLASNIGVYVYKPEDSSLDLTGGRHRIEGIVELPVLCFNDLDIGRLRHQRILQISSTGWQEQRAILERAHAAGVDSVVILTHPFEFFKRADAQCSDLRRNRVNQARLDKLCAFVQAHPAFRFTTFGSAKDRWLDAAETPAPTLAAPPAPVAARILQNKLNEVFWHY